MDIGELWEAIENSSEFLRECLGCVFNFSGVELVDDLAMTFFVPPCAHCTNIPDPADLETASNLRGQSSLSSAEHNV